MIVISHQLTALNNHLTVDGTPSDVDPSEVAEAEAIRAGVQARSFILGPGQREVPISTLQRIDKDTSERIVFGC